jgi:ribosomal protein L40E
MGALHLKSVKIGTLSAKLSSKIGLNINNCDTGKVTKGVIMVETKFCTRCGEKIDVLAEICPKCGVRQELQVSVKKEKKEPWLAALASFLVPGLGQLYTNQSFGKAALIFCTSILILPYIYGIYDAYKKAQEINEKQ